MWSRPPVQETCKSVCVHAGLLVVTCSLLAAVLGQVVAAAWQCSRWLSSRSPELRQLLPSSLQQLEPSSGERQLDALQQLLFHQLHQQLQQTVSGFLPGSVANPT